MESTTLSLAAELYMALCLLCCLYILFRQRQRPAPMMRIMLLVWPIITLWAGPVGIWAYETATRGHDDRRRAHGGMPGMDMTAGNGSMDGSGGDTGGQNRDTPPSGPETSGTGNGHAMPAHVMPGHDQTAPDPSGYPQHGMKNDAGMPGMSMPGMDMAAPRRPDRVSVMTGTLHCGAGCTLADVIGPFLFGLAPFALFGSLMYGEWALDYVLALIIGVFFQYAGLAAMSRKRGLPLWFRAFKVDFLSLTAWQVGMYGWMAVSAFLLFGPLPPDRPLFWFMMQISMFCGFLTAYPMNWWLMRAGIKSPM